MINEKPVPRRKFMQMLGLAPIAAATASAQIAEEAMLASQIGLGVHGVSGGAVAQGLGPNITSHILLDPKVLAAFKAGVLPDWVKTYITRDIHNDIRGLDPNVAVLRSVSTTAKINMTKALAVRRFYEGADKMVAQRLAEDAFFSKGEVLL